MRKICLDTETTGLFPNSGDRLVEIGCVTIDEGKVRGEAPYVFHAYLNPERDIPPPVVCIHGLSNAYLSDKPVFAEVVDGFLKFIEGAELIIHNAPFDVAFLNMELARLGKGRLEDYCLCITDSLEIARKKFPQAKNTLDALCERYHVDNTEREIHGALLDARLLAEVYVAMGS